MGDPPASAGPPAPQATRSEAQAPGSAEVQASGDGAPYHGETAAAAFGTFIVGGSNRIYSGSCSTQSCSVAAYSSSDGGNTWITSSVLTPKNS